MNCSDFLKQVFQVEQVYIVMLSFGRVAIILGIYAFYVYCFVKYSQKY